MLKRLVIQIVLVIISNITNITTITNITNTKLDVQNKTRNKRKNEIVRYGVPEERISLLNSSSQIGCSVMDAKNFYQN